MSAFLTIAVVHFLALVSPGPDFVMVTKNTIAHSRRIGIVTAIGIALGLAVHTTYCLLGIGLLISRSIVLFNILKFAGAAYLIFIGWKALTDKATSTEDTTDVTTAELSLFQAILQGFLCNVLNPKATLFIFALFTQVIDPHTSLTIQIGYGVYMSTATFVWFAFLASMFSIPNIKRLFVRMQSKVERVMGAVLIALGLKVALSTR